ncbi:hypothetical protein Tco_1474825 [Tanacetum coccineum]
MDLESNPSDINIRCTPDLEVLQIAVMSFASFCRYLHFPVYTDSKKKTEPGRVFWGADEEISDGEPSWYPEYIPLEDEHEFPVEEQPLPPVVFNLLLRIHQICCRVSTIHGRGSNGDDDDGDSFGDDADDEDEDEEDEDGEEEEEHLALVNSAVIVLTVKLVSPPEGTEPVIPPPSTDITTTRARITVRFKASYLFPPERAEVERLLAMPTPPLSPPSAEERLARCIAPSAHSSPLPAHAIGLSQAVYYELQTYLEQVYAQESQLHAHQYTATMLQGLLFRHSSQFCVSNETENVDKYINGLPDNIYGNVKSSRPKTLDETIELVNDLMDQKLRTYAERQTDNKRKADNSSRNNHGHQQQPFKR